MQRHALTDEQWARLQPLLPTRAPGRKATRGDRLFVEAVLFRAKTGIQWRDLPERFGNWKSVYNRFRNWAATKQPRSSMAPSFAHIRMRRAEKGDPTECFGTLSRRFFDQSPRDRRRERAAAPRRADTWRAARIDRCARAPRPRARRRLD